MLGLDALLDDCSHFDHCDLQNPTIVSYSDESDAFAFTEGGEFPDRHRPPYGGQNDSFIFVKALDGVFNVIYEGDMTFAVLKERVSGSLFDFYGDFSLCLGGRICESTDLVPPGCSIEVYFSIRGGMKAGAAKKRSMKTVREEESHERFLPSLRDSTPPPPLRPTSSPPLLLSQQFKNKRRRCMKPASLLGLSLPTTRQPNFFPLSPIPQFNSNPLDTCSHGIITKMSCPDCQETDKTEEKEVETLTKGINHTPPNLRLLPGPRGKR